jgi:hypothetical protein
MKLTESHLIGALLEKDSLPTGTPHCWIQWKGTDVCCDFKCLCGYHGHFDGDFFYFTQCPACSRVYGVGQNVKLHLLTDEEAALIKDRIKTQALEED